MGGNLSIFYNTIVEACNRTNPPCLYSMDYDISSPINGYTRRMGGIFTTDPWYGTKYGTPIQYFDCSGLISYALFKAGYTERNMGYTTFSLERALKSIGWQVSDYTKGMQLQKGDILWYNRYNETKGEWEGHTEAVFDEVKRLTMGASGRGSAWGKAPVYNPYNQVQIHTQNTDSIYPWKKIARDTSGGIAELKIISEDRYLTDSEMLNNAYLIASKLATLGYSMPVICAILGNMARESTMSPILTERGGGGGYGLVQWTPKTDLTNIVTRYNLGDYTKYDVQCTVFDYECGIYATNTQWYDNEHRYLTSVPFMPFQMFKTLERQYSIADLTSAFMVYYERPRWVAEDYRLDIRVHYAELFYETFKNGIFNGTFAFDFGNNESERRKHIVLIDKVRKRRLTKEL